MVALPDGVKGPLLYRGCCTLDIRIWTQFLKKSPPCEIVNFIDTQRGSLIQDLITSKRLIWNGWMHNSLRPLSSEHWREHRYRAVQPRLGCQLLGGSWWAPQPGMSQGRSLCWSQAPLAALVLFWLLLCKFPVCWLQTPTTEALSLSLWYSEC